MDEKSNQIGQFCLWSEKRIEEVEIRYVFGLAELQRHFFQKRKKEMWFESWKKTSLLSAELQ